METGKLKNASREVKAHGKIFLRGVIRTLYGAATFGMVCGAVYGFLRVPNESGYVAVFDFASALAMFIVAVVNMYVMGGKRGRGNGRT